MAQALRWSEGRAAWGFAVPETRLNEVAAHFAIDQDADLCEFYLAVGCDLGNADALAAFDREYLSAALPTLRAQGVAPDLIDEVVQGLREDLLVRRSGEAFVRVVQYAGTGRLRSLVRVSATRLAKYLGRYLVGGSSTVKSTVDASLMDGAISELWTRSDPEAHMVQSESLRLFKTCFAHALKELPAEGRALLRFYFVEELTYQQIAELYDVNRSTICRQLGALRRQLLTQIVKQWRISAPESEVPLDDLLAGELDLSMSRLMGKL